MNNVFQVVVNVNLGAKPNPIPDAQIYELLAKAEASQLSFRPLQFSKPQAGFCCIAIMPPFHEDGVLWMDNDDTRIVQLEGGKTIEITQRSLGFYIGDQHCSISKRLYRIGRDNVMSRLYFIHYLPPAPEVAKIPVNLAKAQALGEQRKAMALAHAQRQQQQAQMQVKQTSMFGPNPSHQQPSHPSIAQQGIAAGSHHSMSSAPYEPPFEKLNSNDESDYLTVRDIAHARFKRNHVCMNEIFSPVSVGDLKKQAKPVHTPELISKCKEDVEKLENELKVMEEKHKLAAQAFKSRSESDYKDMAELSSVKTESELSNALNRFAQTNNLVVIPNYKVMKTKVGTKTTMAIS